MINSFAYIEIDGIPIPVPITDTRLSLYVPVNPRILRTLVTSLMLLKKVSAINLALRGSPGNKMASANAPSCALMCGVTIK